MNSLLILILYKSDTVLLLPLIDIHSKLSYDSVHVWQQSRKSREVNFQLQKSLVSGLGNDVVHKFSVKQERPNKIVSSFINLEYIFGG
jgi:hypothetical protein